MFELSQLRCFVAVAEELHFGRAAERLNLTQPPLSRQIQALETSLGVKLFDRTSRSVRLTRTGQSFLSEARDLLRQAEGAALAARRTACGDAGTLTLGFTAASGYEFLPRLIQRFRAEAPDIDLILKEMVSAQQIDSLVAGRIDVGLVRPGFNRREFGSICIVREALLLAVPVGHPLASAPEISIQDLDGQPFVTYSPYEARYFYDLVAAVFAKAGINPFYVQHISQIHSIMGLVKAGIGLALVPQAAANLRFEGVTLLPVPIDPPRPVELHAIWRASNTDMALETLRRTLKQMNG
ncbi:LysR substrate-binding domain-containing protein [Tianweitania populi]|uniref:Transcriptional regulator n=1 Tax=Tianweitania populi TaxID=1607949 RepID=A0A8J3GL22_9HYPH|nr:LysR substrate-binding domain-containing protein [Tianweitania populi]GHD19531.1 transcriptional regulator [Tianweitania populi]